MSSDRREFMKLAGATALAASAATPACRLVRTMMTSGTRCEQRAAVRLASAANTGKKNVGRMKSAMPADGTNAALCLKRRLRHVPFQRQLRHKLHHLLHMRKKFENGEEIGPDNSSSVIAARRRGDRITS